MAHQERFDPYPLRLGFGLRRYAFGERQIAERLGKAGLPPGVVAETWEVSDHDDEPAVVANGRYRGRRLRELVRAFPEELVRPGWSGPHLPLLVKFLDASHRLPIHVHPDDATARLRDGAPNGKDEAWHVIWAEPGAGVLVGARAGLDRAALRAAFRERAYDEALLRHPISAGDTVLVPGGVLHSFGPGLLILEVQQTSDLSESVMPEDVYGRPLSPQAWAAAIEAALDVATSEERPRPEAGALLEDGPARRVLGCRGPHFALERWTLGGPFATTVGDGGFATVTNLGSGLEIEHPGGRERLERASSCLLPAALGEVVFHPDGAGEAVVCYVPTPP